MKLKINIVFLTSFSIHVDTNILLLEKHLKTLMIY